MLAIQCNGTKHKLDVWSQPPDLGDWDLGIDFLLPPPPLLPLLGLTKDAASAVAVVVVDKFMNIFEDAVLD